MDKVSTPSIWAVVGSKKPDLDFKDTPLESGDASAIFWAIPTDWLEYCTGFQATGVDYPGVPIITRKVPESGLPAGLRSRSPRHLQRVSPREPEGDPLY